MENSDETLPDHFFKFMRTENAMKVLETKSLWFSSPKDFNDPFDCNINLLDFTPSDKTIVEFINEKVIGNRIIRRQEIHKNKRSSHRIRNQVSEQSQTMFYNSGICCFSEVAENILLWAHYSDNHKGVCLKFNKAVSAIGTMTSRVKYKSGYDKVNFWEGQGGAVYHLIFTKSHDWSYEKEIRAFRMMDVGKVDFDIATLTEIIFGCRTEKETIQWFKTTISNLGYKHIEFSQAKQTKSSFNLHFEKI